MLDDTCMRTTLDIDDDILQAAKEIAATEGRTAGKVLSELARKGLTPVRQKVRVRNGVPLLPPPAPGTPPMTMKRVNELRDEW
jgi:hypothetical protein